MVTGTIDKSLARGLVRAETRNLTNALRQHAGDVLKTFHEGVMPHFSKKNRLSMAETIALFEELNAHATSAFTPLWSDSEVEQPTRGRPNALSYEMLHYWINPVEVDGTSNRLMKVAAFSAWGDRKQVAMRAHDTLISFYEHAAHRLLQRCGTHDAAVRAIGSRLVDTMILPMVALHETPDLLAGSELHIPFMDGLLLGTFIERPLDAPAGDYKRIWKPGWKTWTISFPVKAEFVIKTCIGPQQMTERQRWIAFEVEAWLAGHRMQAETIRRYNLHKVGSLWDNGHMSFAEFDELRADFWRMHAKVFGPLSNPPT